MKTRIAYRDENVRGRMGAEFNNRLWKQADYRVADISSAAPAEEAHV